MALQNPAYRSAGLSCGARFGKTEARPFLVDVLAIATYFADCEDDLPKIGNHIRDGPVLTGQNMRDTRDRIRHAASFEIIGLILVVPLGSWMFGLHMADVGVIGVASSLVATGWNYIYNLLFDLTMQRWWGSVQKTLLIRIIHAVLFEGGLLALFAPLIAIYLGISLWQALTIDVSLALFYMIYAFVFNWAYDLVFPLAAD